MRDADEFDLEGADVVAIARLDRHQTVRRFEAVFVQLGLNEGEGQRRAVRRSLDERQHVGNRADVVLVPMREDQRLDLPAPRLEVREIGNDQIDAEQIGLGKHRARVHDDGRVPTRDGHHVEAELAEAAERHDFDNVAHRKEI